MIFDPAKRYAELALYTNVVEAIYDGKLLATWPDSATVGRKFIEVPNNLVAPGYTISDGVFRPPFVPSKIKVMEDAVQDYMDNKARVRGYDSIFTAVTYADEPAVSQFQLEGKAFRAWRSLVWAYCYQVLADVQAGKRVAPTFDQLLLELPVLVLPPAAVGAVIS